MSQSNVRREKQKDEIMQAIESVIKDGWEIDYHLENNDKGDYALFMGQIRDALDGALPGKMPTDEQTENKIKLIDDMITHVETVINAPGAVNYGARKWENAIKYLIKVQVEKGWDIQVLWMFLQSEEIMFEKNKLSYGTLMADPDKMLKMWMPRAHASKEVQPSTDLISLMESHDVR